MQLKTKTSFAKGEAHPKAKLNELQVLNILRQRHECEWTLARLSKHYGLSISSIAYICTGINWKDQFEKYWKERSLRGVT